MNGKKEDIFMLVFVAAFLITVFFMCASRSSIYDLRVGADKVRTELDNAKEAQQREADAIGRASEATHRSTEAISNSQRTTKEIKRMERKDAEIIDECQQILERVRDRGGEENQN